MPPLRDVADLLALFRWLGPWANGVTPRAVTRAVRSSSAHDKAYLYAPEGRAPRGAYLVAPGLHYQGPDDPRLDRFCRVLAASGLLVLAPFLPEFLRLRLAPSTADDLAAAFDDLERAALPYALPPPAIFSISFGSMPGIEVAARASHRDRVGTLVVFGGFADFEATVRFAVTGVTEHRGRRYELPRDPLNGPAVFANMLPFIDVPGDRAALEAAWMEMAVATWGRKELKAPGARDPFAHAIATKLPPELRTLFLMGCHLAPGAADKLEEGFAGAGDAFTFFDPRPHLANVRAPVVVIHGRDDDVIPWFESEKIVTALPPEHPRRLIVTGMASHTGALLPPPRELAQEVTALLATVTSIHQAPRGLRLPAPPRAP
jgi:pimeloyl-ACP methyl ester carboxylesterase